MKHQIGDIVLYGTEGICTVLGTEEKCFGTEALMYYVLESQSKGSRIFVPFANEMLINRIRKPLAEEDMRAILLDIDTLEELAWIENDRERKTANASIVSNGSARDLLVLMKTVQKRRAKMESIGKKLYAHDNRVYHDARALFLSEMTLSLHTNEEEANALLLKTWPSFGMTE